MKVKQLGFIGLLVAAILVVGCTAVEVTAYRTIVGAKAFIGSEKQAHPECADASNTSALCVDLQKATAAKDVMIDAEEVYCAGPQFDTGNGPCTPSSDPNTKAVAAQKVAAAISSYNQILADLKGVL
jgi:hypothetical protein